jgi:hypothetical protein
MVELSGQHDYSRINNVYNEEKQRKARIYDTQIEHGYGKLQDKMDFHNACNEKSGLYEECFQMIEECISSVCFCLNGSLFDMIKSYKGLRQGDLL